MTSHLTNQYPSSLYLNSDVYSGRMGSQILLHAVEQSLKGGHMLMTGVAALNTHCRHVQASTVREQAAAASEAHA